MIVLGVDPGTATTGFAVVESEKGRLRLLAYGVVKTQPRQESPLRLSQIFDDLAKTVKRWAVNELALESVFFNTNAKTAMLVGQTGGVVKLLAAKSKIKLFEYTPLQVKMALTGYGRADKSQVGRMVQKTLSLAQVPKPDDAADAVAIALTHCYSRTMRIRSG